VGFIERREPDIYQVQINHHDFATIIYMLLIAGSFLGYLTGREIERRRSDEAHQAPAPVASPSRNAQRWAAPEPKPTSPFRRP